MTVLSLLHPVLRDYAWGSISAIPELLGTPETGRPQAELWLGAHSSGASVLDNGLPLDEHLAGAGGPEAAGQLPFLMKLLAAERPLSIQAHPDREQAAEGYAREDAAGLALTDPARNYKDRHHKPEVLVAITPFSALCGLREPAESAALLRGLLPEGERGQFAGEVLAHLDAGDLRAAVDALLCGGTRARALAERLGQLVVGADSPLADTIRFTSAHYGDDPGVLVAALMNRIDLLPGESIFLAAGQLHAYLHGLGVEAMASSDNVLRGGLTPKHVDIGELQRVVAFRPGCPVVDRGVRQELDGGWMTRYAPRAVEFEIRHLVLARAAEWIELDGPCVLVVTAGELVLAAGEQRLEVGRGQCAFVGDAPRLRVESPSGTAEAFLTTSPAPPVRENGAKRL